MHPALNRRKLTETLKEHLADLRFDPENQSPRDNSWPGISIITPSFNQAPYLERTILSIHNQRYPNLEHIIIDGGSQDGSVDIIKRYEAVLDYWQSAPDKGHCDAINIGASRATGQYMTWVNSDDLLLPGALHRVASVIRESPATDIVYGNQVEIDQDDRVTKRVFT
ncbi:glycosyltransferase, partial [bacterium]